MADARSIWDGLPDNQRRTAVQDRTPVEGVVFRCRISGRTKARYIEADEGNGQWKTVSLAPKNWKLTIIEREQSDG